uniref:secretin N-terminal domain-containing protein n=1 Tax=Pontibacterium sp. TaxID=2036026 RepID=UPI003567549A
MRYTPIKISSVFLAALLILSGCASTSNTLQLPASGLSVQEQPQVSGNVTDAVVQPTTDPSATLSPQYTRLNTLKTANPTFTSSEDEIALGFSDTEQVSLSADQLPLEEFLHQVLDQLLAVSYTVAPKLEKRFKEPVVLNLQHSISKRELFRLTQRLLTEKQIEMLGQDNIFFIKPMDKNSGKRSLTIGIGNRSVDVPEVDGPVMQIVPVRFGTPRGFQALLKQLFKVQVTAQEEKQFLFVQGETNNVRRALELLVLLDAPASRSREIALIDLIYLQPDAFITSLSELLDAEGINMGRGKNKGPVAVIPLTQRQAVVAFASERSLLQRVYHWARQLDVPGKTTEQRYFLYKPQNARALDMGDSLKQLLTLDRSQASRSYANTNDASEEKSSSSKGSAGNQSAGVTRTQDLTLVVDERQNQLMFYATPAAYEKIRPLLKRLDTAPRQVALEVMIAEVTLTGKLQFGLEWFLQKNNYSIGTKGALGLGKNTLNITAIDPDLGLDVIANLSQTENLVKVLSRPRILVTDGSSATVNVGTDIPVLTSTASNLEGGQSAATIVQTIQYRNTGVVLDVT